MQATVLYGAGDVRVENVPDARLIEPTDALVAVSRACICGSDLWPYKLMKPGEPPRRMGHEAIGVVEAVGSGVRTLKVGDVVVMPFAYSDGTCAFCHEGLHTSCVHGGFFGTVELPGAQAEAVRIPLADGTLVVLPVREDDALMASLLTLSDVMGTGHHAPRARDRPSGWRRRPSRRPPLRGDPRLGAGVLQQSHDQRRAGPGTSVHSRAASRCARGQDRAWPGIRSGHRTGSGSRRLPRHERARSNQGDGEGLRRHHADAQIGKAGSGSVGAGARLHGDEPELRSPTGQAGDDLANPRGR